ncbi:MAG: glycosyltransferase family 4 protein [Proteobacteria bacterium]|nr:glycosyltransferase family 4 protein [Pseudomonadota bacterium]
MLKLLIISHALIQEFAQVRWRKMAADHDVDIRILIPECWYNPHFGEAGAYQQGKSYKTTQFEVCTVPTTSTSDHTRYRIKNLRYHLQDFQPDVIFCIHEEGLYAHLQVILYRKLFYPRAKLIYFSMHAFPRVPRMRVFSPKEFLKKIIHAFTWWLTCYGTQSAVVHCPAIKKQMESDGYRKPIFIQTQIGVNPELFKVDPDVRLKIRGKLGFHGFVIGLAGRLIESKGVLDLLQAVKELSVNWNLLFIGDGSLHEHILNWAKEHGWEKRVYVTGFVRLDDVAIYMNAIDCFVLGTHTNYKTRYRDMFPLVVAQAMSMKLPVIGANGGGIPYQLDGLGLLFDEDDIMTLREHLQELSGDLKRCKAIGNALYERAVDHFCIESMNRKFMDFIRNEVLS